MQSVNNSGNHLKSTLTHTGQDDAMLYRESYSNYTGQKGREEEKGNLRLNS